MVIGIKKLGFSLAEAIVVMGIISIFFAAATKVVTVRKPQPEYIKPHGYYVCEAEYNSNDKNTNYKYQYNRNEVLSSEVRSNDQCNFEPPVGIFSFNMFGIGYKKENNVIGNNSIFFDTFEMYIKEALTISYNPSSTEWNICQSQTDKCTTKNNQITDQQERENLLNTIQILFEDIYNEYDKTKSNINNKVIISW